MKSNKLNQAWAIAVIGFGALMIASQAVEAAFPIITGETATASADDTISVEFPANAVNNNGITINSPDLVTDGAITHSGNSNGHSWAADQFVGNVLGVTLTINLGTVYTFIDGMRVWNYNGFAGTDVGIRTYDLETSPDGSIWTLQLNDQSLAVSPNVGDVPSDNTYDGVYTAVSWTNVQFVRFTIVDTYRGSDDFGGLSEVMFSGIPEPSSLGLIAAGAMEICLLRKRRSMKRGA